jgi:7-hydroxymethyl chlorophyll a reductase
LQTVISDDQAKLGTFQDPAPRWVGNIIAWILNLVGPKGLEFAKYSIDYHYIRNWLYVNRWGSDVRGAPFCGFCFLCGLEIEKSYTNS